MMKKFLHIVSLIVFFLIALFDEISAQGSNCATADPFCTGTTYSFPNSTNVPDAGSVGCLGSTPNPAYYYMEIDQNGSMTINISQTDNSGNGIDVDFICWGPFNSLNSACASNLFSNSGVDCSYSTAAQETCVIPNAQIGEVYVLLLTNFNGSPGTITFSQTGGAGSADCSLLCGVTGFTANPSACAPATNTYSVSGTLSINNPPATGTLTISNSCGGSQVYNAPFSTSINYNFTNITANGGGCTVTATWSADANCNTSVNYTAPAPCTVTPCSMTNINANIGACDPATTTYAVTGTLSFSNAPATGQLIVETCGGNQQVLNAPFTSPVNINIPSVPADGTTNCDVTAYFTADPSCTISVGPYTEPVCLCNMDTMNIVINPCDLATNDYSIDVHLVFTSPPSTGQLVIQNCSGDQVTINAPFTSPINTSITGINSDGTANCSVTAYFTADPGCTITSPTFTEPASCACPADAGQTNAAITGNATNNYILCQNDQIDLNEVNSSDPNDVGSINGTAYAPGIGFLIYTCPPTAGLDPVSDPCFAGAISPASPAFFDINDPASWYAAFPAGTFTNNTMYYVPFTFYNAGSLTYNVNCWDVGAPVAVTYLDPIVANGVENCQAGTVTVTVSGGYPALFGGNFTASALSPASASFNNTTCGNNGTIVISGLQGGDNYSFTITDDNGCPYTFSGGPFTAPDVPVITPAGPFCLSDPSTNLSATFPGGTWNGTGITNTTTGTFDPATAGLGTHQIIYTAPGCGSSDTIQVVVNDVFDATITPAGPFCASNANTFLVAADPGGTWSGPGIVNASTGEFSPSTAGAGTHTITYTIGGGCGDTQTTNIQVIADADATINPAGPFCITDPALNLTAVQTGGVWSGTGITSAANGTFNPATAGTGTHTITYTISGVCGDTQTTDIIVTDTIASTITPAGPYCLDHAAVNLTAANPGGTWSGTGITNANTGTFDPAVSGPGSFVITYTIGGNCGTTSTTTIVVNDLPAVSFTVDNASGCTPVQFTVTNTSTPVGTNCSWSVNGNPVSSGCASYSDTYVIPGCYDISLETTDANGCTSSATVVDMVCVYAIPNADFDWGPTDATVLDPVINFTNQSTGASSYEWNFAGLDSSNAVNPSFTFPDNEAGSYDVCLTATSPNGCQDSICKIIVIYDEFLVYVPNAFTPDGDGVNDIFMPIVSGHDPKAYEFMIFNRWGELIFSATSSQVGWDGTYKGVMSKEDVYVWKLKLKREYDGEKKVYYGHVSLLK